MIKTIDSKIDENLRNISNKLLDIAIIIGNLKSASTETDKVFNVAKDAYSELMTLCYNVGELKSYIK